VSSTTQVAVLGRLGRDVGASRRVRDSGERPLVRLTAFAALGLYGVLRWGTLMTPAPTWRLIGLLALAVALAGVAPMLIDRERAVAAMAGRSEPLTVVGAPLALMAILLAFPLTGVPLGWIVHLRVAVTADGISQGLSALPGILVPYSGVNEWARVVMLLGAAVLLLDAGLLLAFAPSALGDIRRAGAALPLIALVVVPATLVHPHLAYLQGLILFALLAFFMWGERVAPDRRLAVVLACAATGALGMIVGPALDQHSPWFNYEALTRGFTPAHVERFDWTQRYGPLVWPRTGNVVLDVSASPKPWTGEYWKTENLDTFNGVGWLSGGSATGGQAPLSPRTVARWTQKLTVTLRAMRTTQIVGAGTMFAAPAHLQAPALPGSSAGTWVSQTQLGPGDSYTAQVYAPHPSAAALARTGETYPLQVREADLTLALPQQGAGAGASARTVLFPTFGSRGVAPQNEAGAGRSTGLEAIQNSPYAPAYATAQRLARTARTPYAYVQRVLAFLADGYTYDEYPPPTAYPLETFLFRDRLGYCQQFAGAMALLLRMGGVPARVATGFTTGTFDTATNHWLVSDVDAHAWVEAWFPRYGWVTFDPTPAAAPARGGHSAIGSATVLGSADVTKVGGPNAATAHGVTTGSAGRRSGGSATPVVLGMLGVLAALLLFALVAWTRTGPLDADGLLSELERALARSGRPLSDGVTLAALERRFRTSPEAASYVRTLRMARYGGEPTLPSLRQRRALRAQLRAGLGLGGALRSLWALPPRPKRARWRRRA
jgi:transglutaminase-like putative cysteine protease